ncbi:amino acid ABC transporter permease [Pararhodobacter aggregans]|uniref:Amino acid ABC transporter permease n=1 Tax=Pararhodobacter aggregans TaxID=404875 RepID=A0A2T7UST5_9RHOB|nr:amino acid ABC transporter permease [Pararhodobacter aggregans]PTX03384.1 amino acid ABC transporter membrane protein 2 (PAAT family) [Pararhodobacter aggregans]PVE47679.1 amino acid ABC transporter permease [Pararhodobacter aggregans]
MIEILQEYWLQLLIGGFPHTPLGGLALTLVLAVSGLVLAMPVGLLMAVPLRSRLKPVRALAELIIFYIRSVPLLLHVLWVYFLLPAALGVSFPPAITMLITLVLFNGAYISKIVVAGIDALPRGQTEAAMSLGFGPVQTMRFIILPQALRNMLPSLVSQLSLLIKETALGAAIGATEATQTFLDLANNLPGQAIQAYALLALAYFALCYPLLLLGRRLERRGRRTAKIALEPAS